MKGKKAMKHRIRGITAWILSFAAVISSVPDDSICSRGRDKRDSVISDSGDIEKSRSGRDKCESGIYRRKKLDEEIYETVPRILSERMRS